MGLLDDLYSTELGAIRAVPGTTRANYDKLKGLLGVDSTGNGLLSDLNYGARNALSQAKWNAGNRLDKIQQYLTDPSARFQPSTPESRASIDESLMNLGSSVMPGAMGGVIKTYHGTPHRFDAFDMSKIGTGEGAQAYGHGLYFADHPGVANGYTPRDYDFEESLLRHYNKASRNGKYPTAEILERYLTNEHPDEVGNYLSELRKEYANPDADQLNVLAEMEAAHKLGSTLYANQKAGHLYNVDLQWPNPEQEFLDPFGHQHLLDWDKPLSQQPDRVKAVLEKINPKGAVNPHGFDMGGGTILDNRNRQADPSQPHPWVLSSGESKFGLSQQDVDRMLGEMADATGENIYSRLTGSKGGQSAASEFLRQLGIPGIRYLDGGSRGVGGGTSNYVIFDDAIPRIKTRNGKSLLED